MNASRGIVAGTVVFLAMLGLGEAVAQNAGSRTVDQYSCKDVMREHGGNRDVVIAFLHGYMLGKSGGSAFDIDAMHRQTSDFIEYCLDHPAEKAVDAMARIKK